MSDRQGLIVDLFAGGGGASQGIEAATGRPVDIAVNHSATALAVHRANHPRTHHLTSDIWEVDPKLVAAGRPVDILWASPDCTHFSRAKGSKPREQGIRSLAWVVVEWAKKVRPAVIFLENVAEFQTWGPLGTDGRPDKSQMGATFAEWKGTLEALGYVVDYRVLDASAYGAPTRRRRLFLVARCDGQPISWPKPTHGPGLLPYRVAAECIDWSLPCPSIFSRKRALADKTLARIALGIRKFVIDAAEPFIVPVASKPAGPVLIQTGYGERKGQAPRALDLHEPMGTLVAGGVKQALVAAFLAKHYGGHTAPGSDLRARMDTITAQDHHALVTAFLTTYYGSPAEVGQDLREPLRTVVGKDRFGLVMVGGEAHVITDIGMRMLEPHELLRAQFGEFAPAYDLSQATTKAAQVRLIGNSVCPEVARAVVAANLPGQGQGRRAA